MSRTKWAAVPIILVTLLLVAGAAALIAGRQRPDAGASTQAPAARQESAPVAQQARQEPANDAKAQAPARQPAAQVNAPKREQAASKPAAPAREKAGSPPAKPARSEAKALRPKAQSRAAAPENSMGWRLGTRWTVKVQEYDSLSAQQGWDTYEYGFEVTEAGRSGYTVSMRFADQAAQPESARGDLLRVGYVQKDGNLELAWIQPLGKGRKLTPEEAELLLGESALPLAVPDSPFTGDIGVSAVVPEMGRVQANKVKLNANEALTFAKGAPWWVSYTKGQQMKAEMTSFER